MERPQSPPEQSTGAPDWPHVEDGFWRSLQSTYEAEDKLLADEYRKSKASIQVTLSELYHERSSVAERLRRIDALCSAEEARMETLQSQFEDNRRVRFAMRDGTVAKMRQWFITNRGGSAAGLPPPTPGLPFKTSHPMNVGAPMASARSVPLPSVVTNEPTGVEICDIAGNVLGPLNKIRTRNPAIDAISERPVIKRRVKVRPNRKYGSQNLSLLYEPTDTKGGKWIACMIQAIGEVQPRKCTICQKGQGPFEECIMLDRDGFNKCGNCEWSRQGCHGSTRDPNGPVNPNAPEGDRDPSVSRQLALRSPGAASVNGPTLAARPVAGGAGQISSPSAASAVYRPSYGPAPAGHPASPTVGGRTALIGPVPRHNAGPNAAGPSTGAAHQAAVYTPNPNKHHLIESSNTPYHSNAPSLGDDDASEAEEEPEMITPENLAIKHDGTVYTEPECLRGVPVAKVDPSHPYWDASWENIEDLIRPQYEKWLVKQDQVLKTGGVVQHAKFQIGRQVNRGARILEFLKTGSISPYQLLAKQYMPAGKGGIISYDTLFRLANTLEELAQFKQQIDPVDWLRHRLHEILTVEGDKFSLARTMHGFYHDPKLSALRKKSGFSQIGRPSRVRHRSSMGSGGGSGGPAVKRRKGNDSPRATPPMTPGLWRGPPTPADQTYTQRSPTVGNEDQGEDILMADDAADDGNVTDTDSYCGEAIEPTDFRVYQVKHRTLSSNPAMTQYWHWLDDEDERSLQHQVLKDVNPTQWGMYREPLNFSVNFQEVLEVLFAPSSQRVVVVMDETSREDDGKPRGDVLVHFKRDRTLRRFCNHMASKGIRVTQTSLENVEDRWDRMQCPMLPANDDDDNIEV
jgi:hypothetical protein